MTKEQRNSRLLIVLLFIMMVALVVVGCGGKDKQQNNEEENQTTEQTPTKATELRIVTTAEPVTLDMMVNDGSVARQVTDSVLETLVLINMDNYNLEGVLATSWEMVDDKTWEINLREGVKFTDGTPFNAAAVVKNVERILSDKSVLKDFLETIDHAEEVSDSVVRIITKVPDPILIRRLLLMSILNPDQMDADAELAAKPIGTGPYKVEEWKRGQKINLVANKDYWGNKPKFERVIFQWREEPSVRLSMLKAGEADLADSLPVNLASEAPKTLTAPMNEQLILRFAPRDGILADKRVRQALDMSLDREAIVRDVLRGFGSLPKGQMHNEATFGFDTSMSDRPYDPEKARELIKEAGATGKTITLIGSNEGPWPELLSVREAIVAMFKATGINVQEEVLNLSKWIEQMRNLQQNSTTITMIPPGNEMFDATRGFDRFVDPDKGSMTTFPKDKFPPDILGVLRNSYSELDEQKRLKELKQVSNWIQEDVPFIVVLRYNFVWGAGKNINWQPRMDARIFIDSMTVN